MNGILCILAITASIFEGADHGDKAFDTFHNIEEVVVFLDNAFK